MRRGTVILTPSPSTHGGGRLISVSNCWNDLEAEWLGANENRDRRRFVTAR